MGLRFRKSIRLLPGIKINLSKSGTSLSVGRPGATTNINADGIKSTVGLPGTGILYQTPRQKAGNDNVSGKNSNRTQYWIIMAIVIALAVYQALAKH